jgi:SAM-dependent methyltransferase
MQRNDYTEANRQAWNEAAPVHGRQKMDELRDGFRKPGYSCLDPVETAILKRIGVKGKAVAQLCCNNGRELLSVKNLGAGRCVGFDISESFIAQARELASIGGIDCEFLATDVYAIPAHFDGQFDLITITIGALGWMPDIGAFLAIPARLLRAGGQLFIYEQHPILNMFEPGDAEPLMLRHSYFKAEPFRDTAGLDYWGGKKYDSKPMYWFSHKLSDVIGGCLAGGLAIESFREYGHDISNVFAEVAAQPIRPPMSYSLVARKTG